MGTLRASRRYNNDPFTAEAIALLEVVSFCKDARFSSIILEGDALQVVKLLGEEIMEWSEGGLIIKDTRILLNSFAKWSIQHIKRKCNEVAQILAENALKFNLDILELEVVPVCVKDIVMLDAI